MAQTDLAIRRLADLLQEHLPRLLLPREKIERVTCEPTQLKIIERDTDKVLRMHINSVETIVNIEFQASADDTTFPSRLLAYHALLRHRFHPLPVRSVVLYLMHEPPARPVPQRIPRSRENPQVEFCFDVVGLWEFPITLDDVRANPLLGPLAPLTPAITERDLPSLQAILEQQVRSQWLRGDLLALTWILARRRFTPAMLQSFKWSAIMLDSPGYQEILKEGEARGKALGKAEGLREKLVKLVSHRLGHVPPELPALLEAMNTARLDSLFDQVLETESRQKLEALVGTVMEGGG